MTTLRDDTFGRADENPLGSPYATPTGAPGSMKLASNVVTGTAASTDCSAYDNGNTYPEEQWCEVTISAVGSSDGGPVVGFPSGSWDGYLVTAYSGAQIMLYRISGGGFNLLAQATDTYAVGSVIYVERKVNGGNSAHRDIVVKKNGTTIITYTDTAPLTGGKPGMNVYDGTLSFSRFKAGDFNAAAAAQAFLTMPPTQPPMARGRA